MEPQKIPNSQRNSEKEQIWNLTFPDFNLFYKAIVMKRV